jgi:iron(III) transport system substrate-binding protein
MLDGPRRRRHLGHLADRPDYQEPMNRTSLFASALVCVLAGACAPHNDLVVYCSLDQEFAEPLIQQYAKSTGLEVHVEFDVEANKTVGLVQRLREESKNPRCDVFWNNEFAHTVQMGRDGLLEAYASPSAKDIPASFKEASGKWSGFAARARIFIVNTDLCDPKEITSMWDLVDPKWAGKAAMALPLNGTTLTHMACLYDVLGEAKAEEYVQKVSALGKSGALNLANGNSTIARVVGDGKFAFGWTDTDDFAVALERGAHVVAVYPDANGVGTLLIPNTICMVKGAPHPEAARKFVDWALSDATEKALAYSRSVQIPVRAGVERPPSIKGTKDFKPMSVDFEKVGADIEKRAAHFRELFVE